MCLAREGLRIVIVRCSDVPIFRVIRAINAEEMGNMILIFLPPSPKKTVSQSMYFFSC